jgi:serine/threonine protein kinase
VSLIGRVVAGRYRLMEVVGRGGYSLVYRGVDRATDEQVAVKVLHDGLPNKEELEARLEREHSALVALEGTAALVPRGLHLEDGRLCLVTEYLRGQDFDEYLTDIESQGLLIDLRTFAEYLAPIVDTLEVAHDRGILHRDLKPGNIFILGRGGPGGVRLLDFGFSTSARAARITRDGMVIGSPSYIAPEVWEGKPGALDHRVDVYALGAIMFRALGGRIPFPAGSIREKIHAARHAPRPSLRALRPELPPGVDAWVAGALAVDRAERFAHVRPMWTALCTTLDIRSGGSSDGDKAK